MDLFGNNRRKGLSNIFRELNDLYSRNGMFNFDELGMFGDAKTQKGSDKFGDWKETTFTSEDGTMSFTSYVRTYGDTISQKDTNDIRTLKEEMEVAIEEQDFESAAKIRDKIKHLEENQEKISELEDKLNKAIKEHDFEEAIKYRDKLKELKK